ncbi:MAG: hypothetical protein K6G17_05580 [Oscillospiraceae bacterium]|nr:hypothetical protein [Oscillospiraceae bacterium]
MRNTAKKEIRHRGALILLYWVGIVALLLLLTTATYTWFAISRTPRVNDMYLTVSAPNGLQIASSYDAEDEDWVQLLDFDELLGTKDSAPLRPCTWSEANGRFFAATYGSDGRLTSQWWPLNDADNANRDDANGYYLLASFYARTDTDVRVSLGAAEVSEDETESSGTYLIGSPKWNGETAVHDNGGLGAENAVRIGLRVTPIDGEGRETGESVFYIYEPNCNAHADGSDEILDTPSIDGTETLVPRERLFSQTASTWTELRPAQRSAVLRQMGEFTSSTGLFELEAGGMEKIDIYVWLEGQDKDCSAYLSRDASILASLLLETDYSSQSGLVEIED